MKALTLFAFSLNCFSAGLWILVLITNPSPTAAVFVIVNILFAYIMRKQLIRIEAEQKEVL